MSIDPSVSSFAAEQLEEVVSEVVETEPAVEAPVVKPAGEVVAVELPLSAMRVSSEGVVLSKVAVNAEGVVVKVLEA